MAAESGCATYCQNPMRAGTPCAPEIFSREQTLEAAAFLEEFSGYSCPTPLARLDSLAAALGLGKVFIKDESHFAGLGAFKARGCGWAMSRLARKSAASANDTVFVSATDGNHGAGVAYTARQLGHRAEIFMPAGAIAERVEKIRSLGAKCLVTDMNYDDAVRLAANHAIEHGHMLVQDTGWPGYEEVPLLIMQGYATLAHEIMEQLEGMPTHVFLQIGVGSFAGAMIGAFVHGAMKMGMVTPIFIGMEPANAACVHKSLIHADGHPHAVKGSLSTVMAGLSCGEINPVAWPILRDNLDFSVSCDDSLAISGMRLLAQPIGNDPLVIAGESGAVGAGFLAHVMHWDDECMRKSMRLDGNSRVLLISTEGATNPELWEKSTGKSLAEIRADGSIRPV